MSDRHSDLDVCEVETRFFAPVETSDQPQKKPAEKPHRTIHTEPLTPERSQIILRVIDRLKAVEAE